MRITEKKFQKFYKINHKRFNVDVEVNALGSCKVHFPNLSYMNTVYLGEIGCRGLKIIGEILIKAAELGEKEEKKYEGSKKISL